MNRQPEGIPTGGQFAASAKTEPDVALEAAEPSIEDVCEKAGYSSVAPFLRILEAGEDSVRGLTVDDVASLYDSIGDRPNEAAEIAAVHSVESEMSYDEAAAHIDSLSEDYPLASELLHIALERETLEPHEASGFNAATATLIETQISSKVLKDMSSEIDSINDDRCSCGADLNDGEGYGGLCGNCADRSANESADEYEDESEDDSEGRWDD